jgi:hypothetical protein
LDLGGELGLDGDPEEEDFGWIEGSNTLETPGLAWDTNTVVMGREPEFFCSSSKGIVTDTQLLRSIVERHRGLRCAYQIVEPDAHTYLAAPVMLP